MNAATLFNYILRRYKQGNPPDIELTASQKVRFATWEAGFEAHAAGVPVDGAPRYRKGPNSKWVEGWLASQRMEQLMTEQTTNPDQL